VQRQHGHDVLRCEFPLLTQSGHDSETAWSFTVYDSHSRSMLDTPQRYSRASSQSYPSPAAEASADGPDDGLLCTDATSGRAARQLASGEETGERPFLYVVGENKAFIDDGNPDSLGAIAYRAICINPDLRGHSPPYNSSLFSSTSYTSFAEWLNHPPTTPT
jgi:hypothetical protein